MLLICLFPPISIASLLLADRTCFVYIIFIDSQTTASSWSGSKEKVRDLTGALDMNLAAVNKAAINAMVGEALTSRFRRALAGTALPADNRAILRPTAPTVVPTTVPAPVHATLLVRSHGANLLRRMAYSPRLRTSSPTIGASTVSREGPLGHYPYGSHPLRTTERWYW
jgi:hypothetical protein